MESCLTGVNTAEDDFRPYGALQEHTADSYSTSCWEDHLQVLYCKAGLQQGGSKVVKMHKTIPSQVPQLAYIFA